MTSTSLARAEEWNFLIRDVYTFPPECSSGEKPTGAVEIWEVDKNDIYLRPNWVCVKKNFHFEGNLFIAPDGEVYGRTPQGAKLDKIILEFLTQQ